MYPVRNCVGCSNTDDHPRHVIALPDGNTATYHLDCHALIAGCESCTAQLAEVGGVDGNPTGQALRDRLEQMGPTPEQPGWTAPDYRTDGEG